MTVGPFRLQDPPPGQREIVEGAVAAIRFPWRRLNGAAITVRWTEAGMGQISGSYNKSLNRITLSSLPRHLDAGAAFVFAHEVGHMIDDLTLTDSDRAQLTDLLHPGITLGHIDHDHPDTEHVSEGWGDSANSYVARLNEAFADLFVATFAPSIWDGMVGGAKRHPRFVHWTTDLREAKRIILHRRWRCHWRQVLARWLARRA